MNDADDRAFWAASEEGAELVREGELQTAVGTLADVITAQPGNYYAHFFLGSAYFEAGDPLRALKAYLKAVELKPDYLGALVHSGWSLHALGRFREALRVGRQVLLKSKDDPDALYLLGLCHYALGEPAAALGYLNRFMETRPEVEVLNEVAGLIKVLHGEVQPARAGEDDEDD